MNQKTLSEIDRLFLEVDEDLSSRKPLSARDRRLLKKTRKAAILFEIFRAEQRNDALDAQRLRKIYREELHA